MSVEPRLAVVCYRDGVTLYGNRSYWKRFAEVALKLATCPPEHYCESHAILSAGDELIGVFEAHGSIEDDTLRLERLPPDAFDVNHMCVEERDFARYNATAEINRGD